MATGVPGRRPDVPPGPPDDLLAAGPHRLREHPVDVGPFYCPASFGVYLDPTFFAALSRKVGVRLGDFAQAYVVAHEVGHHVQTLLGITHQKAAADEHDPARANARSVRFELQADCFAGVWLHSV